MELEEPNYFGLTKRKRKQTVTKEEEVKKIKVEEKPVLTVVQQRTKSCYKEFQELAAETDKVKFLFNMGKMQQLLKTIYNKTNEVWKLIEYQGRTMFFPIPTDNRDVIRTWFSILNRTEIKRTGNILCASEYKSKNVRVYHNCYMPILLEGDSSRYLKLSADNVLDTNKKYLIGYRIEGYRIFWIISRIYIPDEFWGPTILIDDNDVPFRIPSCVSYILELQEETAHDWYFREPNEHEGDLGGPGYLNNRPGDEESGDPGGPAYLNKMVNFCKEEDDKIFPEREIIEQDICCLTPLTYPVAIAEDFTSGKYPEPYTYLLNNIR